MGLVAPVIGEARAVNEAACAAQQSGSISDASTGRIAGIPGPGRNPVCARSPLGLGLDAFRQDPLPHAVSHCDHRLHDRAIHLPSGRSLTKARSILRISTGRFFR